MLVCGDKGIMRPEVTYGVSRIECVVRSSCVRLCSFLLFSLPYPPSLVDLVSIGLVSISTDLVSVTVPGGWLPLMDTCVPCSRLELPWIPACPALGLWLKARC